MSSLTEESSSGCRTGTGHQRCDHRRRPTIGSSTSRRRPTVGRLSTFTERADCRMPSMARAISMRCFRYSTTSTRRTTRTERHQGSNGWQEVVRESGRGSRSRTPTSATQKAADVERFFGSAVHPGIGHRRRARRACGNQEARRGRVSRVCDGDDRHGPLDVGAARRSLRRRGRDGPPVAAVCAHPARTGFDPARHRAPPTTLPQ
jgi:hypothetical protein